MSKLGSKVKARVTYPGVHVNHVSVCSTSRLRLVASEQHGSMAVDEGEGEIDAGRWGRPSGGGSGPGLWREGEKEDRQRDRGREGGRERGREGAREGGRQGVRKGGEGGREGGRERGREGVKEGGREGGRKQGWKERRKEGSKEKDIKIK